MAKGQKRSNKEKKKPKKDAAKPASPPRSGGSETFELFRKVDAAKGRGGK